MTFVDTLKGDLGANSKFKLKFYINNCEDWHARCDTWLRST